jgi:iron complex outermembrane receptor protein
MSKTSAAALLGALSLSLFVWPSGPAAAQRAPVRIDTLQTVGSRLPSGLAGHTRAVETLTREQIAALPVGTVTRALEWVFGTDVMSRSEAQADLSISGSSYEQVLVLVDGVPMSDPQTGHFDLDITVPLNRIERIEILRGPASATYGSDATGGVVNIVTREPATGAGFRLEAGSFGTVAGTVDGGYAISATGIAAGAAAQLATSRRLLCARPGRPFVPQQRPPIESGRGRTGSQVHG